MTHIPSKVISHSWGQFTFFRDLPKDIFYGTPNLKEIILDKNHLMMIRPEWFATATQVTRLSLGENRIKDLSSSIFQPLRNLKVLTLEKNEIRQLRAGSFPGTSSLHTLTLAENNITHVDNYVFRDMLSLRELDFRGNHVKVDSHFEAWKKWLTSCRNFQMHFAEWKLLFWFKFNFTICLQSTICQH